MRILMLGNSFTFTNNMPQMLADLTGAEVVHHTRGGARLSEQLNPNTRLGNQTQAALQNEQWDYVVLQEMSHGPTRWSWLPACAVFRARTIFAACSAAARALPPPRGAGSTAAPAAPRRTPMRWSAGFSYNLTQKVHLRCACASFFFPHGLERAIMKCGKGPGRVPGTGTNALYSHKKGERIP